MKFLTLTLHTMHAALSQKITTGILAAVAILLFIIIFTVHIYTADGMIKTVSIYGSKPIQGADFPYILPKFAEIYTTIYFLGAMLLGVIATAQIIPEAINSRTFMFYLSKPLSRRSIILAIFSGVTIAIVFIQLMFVISLWIILTAKTSIWNWNILLSIIPLIAAFSSMYALMIYVGIIGKSTGIVTGLAMVHVLLISHLLSSQNHFFGLVFGKPVDQIFWNITRAVLPSVHELQEMTFNIIISRSADLTILFLPLLPCALYLWLSVRAFRRMDF
jgi:ABC-type transport system involved in multi-copper enzyme maturation permease subunit